MHLTLSLLVACATIVSALKDAYVGQDKAGNLYVNATEGRAVFVNGVDVQAMQISTQAALSSTQTALSSTQVSTQAALSSTQVSTQAALSSTASTHASTVSALASTASTLASTLAALSSMQIRIQALESPAKVGGRALAREW